MLEKKIQSFYHSFTGLKVAWQEESNFRIQVALAFLALFFAWFLEVSSIELIIVFFLIGFVLSAEALNTALEEFCDMVKSDPDPHIGRIKDLAASAVLISSTTALIVGAIIFLPRFLSLV